MQQPEPDFPLPYPPEQRPPKKVRQRYKLFMLFFIAITFVLIGAISAYLWTNKSDTTGSSDKRLFTYYYRDGKTVLWQGVEPFAEDSPAFVNRVFDDLTAKYGTSYFEKNNDWKIVTTLDESLQELAEQQLAAQSEQLLKQGGHDAALMAQDVTTGQIVSWADGTGKHRLRSITEVGTLALPLVYAAYLESTDANADTTILDVQEALPGYPCTNTSRYEEGGNCLQNFDRRYLGQITLRQALGGLRLAPAAKAMATVVPDDNSPGRIDSMNKTIQVIETMMENDNGFSCYHPQVDVTTLAYNNDKSKEETQCYLASSHGDGVFASPQDLMRAYTVLANNGKQLPQTSLLKVELNGKVVDEWKADGGQIVEADAANIIGDILSDPEATYMARRSWFRIGDNGETKVSVAPGTTYDGSVASAVMYTPKYAVGFWAFGTPGGTIKGFSDTLTLPPTSGWLTAAQNE